MNTNIIWSKNFILASIGSFLIFSNFYMLLSGMPLAVQQFMNGTAKDSSLVVAIYLLGIFVLRPVSGIIADKIGKRKISVITLLLFAICSFAYLGTSSIIPLLIVRFIHGVFHSVSTTAHAAMSIDMIPSDKKGQGIGYYGLAMSLSMVLGPAIGIYILNNYDFQTLIFIATIFAGLGFLTTLFISKNNTEVISAKKEKTPLKLASFVEPKSLAICSVALLFSFCYSSLISFMAVYTKELQLGEAAIYFFIAFGISILVSRPFIGKLLDSKGPSFLLVPSLVIFALGMAYLSQASTSTDIILSSLILGVSYGAIFPSFQTITVKLSPPHRIGVATATFFLFYDAGFGLGAFFLASIAADSSFSSMYLVVSSMTLVTLAMYYFIHHLRTKQVV